MKRMITLCTILFISSTISYSQLRFSLQAGLQAPTGDFSDFATLGYGFGLTGEYVQATSPIAFTGSIGYNTWGAKGSLPEGWDYKFRAIPVLVGFRLYLSRGEFHPYLGAEMGLFFTSTDQTRLAGPTRIITSTSDTDFGFVPILGFKYHLSTMFDLDVNFKYNIITTSGSSTTFLGINAGLQFQL